MPFILKRRCPGRSREGDHIADILHAGEVHEQALEADRYSLDMLQRLDAQIAAIQTSVRAGADQLETKVTRAEEHADVEARDRAIRQDSAATT